MKRKRFTEIPEEKKFLKRMNSRGEKLISVYWFAILVIVATGIVLMVNVFYGGPYDIRKIESGILAEKVADCIYFGGKINPLLRTPQGDFREDFRDKFLERCSLNFTIDEDFKRPPYYIEVEFFSEGNLKKPSFLMSKGNKNWKPDCKINVSGNDKLAKCSEKEFFMKTSSDSYYLVKITSIVGKVEENVN